MWFPFITIYNPHGQVIERIYPKPNNKGHKTESKAFNEATEIVKLFMHGEPKIPIGSFAKKEALTEFELLQRIKFMNWMV